MEHYINRELSWLEFNQRVLGEAQNPKLALLERLKFLAITGSNLDEFFQVRVGGLSALKHARSVSKDIAGLTVIQQLKLIRERSLRMCQDQYALLSETLIPELKSNGLHITEPKLLPQHINAEFTKKFEQFIAPLLTPIALEDGKHPVFLKSLQINIIAELSDGENVRHVLVSVPKVIERFSSYIEENNTYLVSSEDLISENLALLFPDETVVEYAIFRATRNADIILEDEESSDYVNEMTDVLMQRNYGHLVRLELQGTVSQNLREWIDSITESSDDSVFKINHFLGLSDFMRVAFSSGFEHLREESWSPQPSVQVDVGESMFENISKNDILLHHPYESFEPVIKLIEEAASDPNTLAIKQVLYRTAKHSRIIDALIKAARQKKQVTVLVELKARFDEANNLQRADELRKAGVQIVYGVKNLKTHAKIAMIIRNEGGKLARYLHLGTGNYNESTAKMYTDISYLTKNGKYGADASTFFNAVTGRSQITDFNKLLPAPTHMKKALLTLIHSEIERAKSGEKALIMAKVNSLQDKEIIDALYKASAANVEIKLNVRGVCCLKPGTRKEAKNIHVVSVIDRYLEHARIFYFHQGGEEQVFISSADWMTRNLDKRVELMIPIEDSKAKRKLTKIIESAFKDNQNAHIIQDDGTSLKNNKKGASFRLQLSEQKKAEKAYANLKYKQTTTYEPHV